MGIGNDRGMAESDRADIAGERCPVCGGVIEQRGAAWFRSCDACAYGCSVGGTEAERAAFDARVKRMRLLAAKLAESCTMRRGVGRPGPHGGG